MEKPPMLYIFSGLPGVGKTTLAKMLAQKCGAAYLRIDTIEHSLRHLFQQDIEGEGYRLSYRIAADQLSLGLSVVADSCNPITLTRHEWRQVARDTESAFVDIEIICSNLEDHRDRVTHRKCDIPGHKLPTWVEVQAREYHPRNETRLVIDTAFAEITTSFQELLDKLSFHQDAPGKHPRP